MKLTFVLCAALGVITAAAVTFGFMNSPSQVTAPAKNIPITEPSAVSRQEETKQPEEIPRFVYDEPLSQQPVTSTMPVPSKNTAPTETVSASPSQKPVEIQSEPPTVIAIDSPPTAEEISEVSAEHLRELDALIDRITSSLDSLAQQALTDYRMLPDPNNMAQLGILMARYLPSVYELERDADAEAEEIFKNLDAALDAIGADNSVTAEARVSYEAAKAAQLNYYKELANAYSIPIG